MLSLLSLLSLASFADVPQVLTYRGVLRRTGGYERAMSLEMTFRLYDSKAPDTALCRAGGAIRSVFAYLHRYSSFKMASVASISRSPSRNT